MAGQGFTKIWNAVEAYPLFAAVGTAVTAMIVHSSRELFCAPDVRLSKNDRAVPIHDNEKKVSGCRGAIYCPINPSSLTMI